MAKTLFGYCSVGTYKYDVASDNIENSGLIIAGNNKKGTQGVSPTTLTGRQWGIALRHGAAWQLGFFHNKVVVRAGGGMYYDRGELFTYFSHGYAIGTVTGGPFGVNQQLPFVNVSSCPVASVTYLYYYLPTCGGTVDPETGNEIGSPSDAAGDLGDVRDRGGKLGPERLPRGTSAVSASNPGGSTSLVRRPAFGPSGCDP